MNFNALSFRSTIVREQDKTQHIVTDQEDDGGLMGSLWEEEVALVQSCRSVWDKGRDISGNKEVKEDDGTLGK